MLGLFPAVKNPKKPGRPATVGMPSVRRKHLRCLFRRRVLGMPIRTIAVDMKVSQATVKRWLRLAKAYPEAASRQSLSDAVTSN